MHSAVCTYSQYPRRRVTISLPPALAFPELASLDATRPAPFSGLQGRPILGVSGRWWKGYLSTLTSEPAAESCTSKRVRPRDCCVESGDELLAHQAGFLQWSCFVVGCVPVAAAACHAPRCRSAHIGRAGHEPPALSGRPCKAGVG